VFAAVAAHARGHSLVARVRAPELATRRYGDVPAVAASATHDPESGQVSVFLTNRRATASSLEIRHEAFERWRTVSAVHLAADEAGPRDRAAAAEVGLSPLVTSSEAGTTRITLPPQSWTVLRGRTD
jgi:alpha-N-arabinofuranosidase